MHTSLLEISRSFPNARIVSYVVESSNAIFWMLAIPNGKQKFTIRTVTLGPDARESVSEESQQYVFNDNVNFFRALGTLTDVNALSAIAALHDHIFSSDVSLDSVTTTTEDTTKERTQYVVTGYTADDRTITDGNDDVHEDVRIVSVAPRQWKLDSLKELCKALDMPAWSHEEEEVRKRFHRVQSDMWKSKGLEGDYGESPEFGWIVQIDDAPAVVETSLPNEEQSKAQKNLDYNEMIVSVNECRRIFEDMQIV